MMNTKEDGRCHPPHVDPFDVQCKAFYVSVCLVLHCVGYSTERDVCTTNGGKEERRIEEKKEEQKRDRIKELMEKRKQREQQN